MTAKRETDKGRGWISALAGMAGFGLALKAGWIFYSRRYIDHHARLTGVIKADQDTFDSPVAGKLHYYYAQTGSRRPILILHGLHMTAGGHDIRPIFEAFRGNHPVYAMDLPGFGGSEKTDRPYRPAMYQAAISDFLRERIGQPADVVALGGSCEFAAAAAKDNPQLFHSLVMIDPTGFQMPQTISPTAQGRLDEVHNLLYTLLAVPLWSRPIFDLFASRAHIMHFYRQRFEYGVPAELVDLAYASGHQPGAHFAPMVLLSGKLSNPRVREEVYCSLKLPVLVLYDNAPGLRLDMLSQVARENASWSAQRLRRSRGMPHFDRPGETFLVMDQFWKKIG